MMRRACRLALLGALVLTQTVGARAEVAASGGTTLRFDRYEIEGEAGALPWKHAGDQFYQDFDLSLAGRPGGARKWDLNAAGVMNQSDYRHAGQGLVPEWLNFRYEDGEGALPYRLELGDQRARFSPLTLDRRLQAARLELQPALGAGQRHSMVWMSGREQTDWRFGTGADNRYHGASWLVDDPALGRYALNTVYQEAGRPADGADAGRLVTSVAAERDFAILARQDVAAEAEWAVLDGRVFDGGPARDQGMRMRLRAVDRSLPLDYEVRYRRYGEGFAPLGTLVERDSRELAANAGWRFPFGMGLRGRYDRTLSQASEQQLASEGYGLSLEAPRTLGLLEWLDHSWDLNRRFRADAWGVVDSRATEARWNLRVADGARSTTRLALAWVGVEDRVAAERGSLERRVALSHARMLDLGFVTVSATPGMDYRKREGAGSGAVFSPTLRMDAARGAHQLGMRLDYRSIDAGIVPEREEYGMLLDYRYRMADHTFGVEYEQLGRERDATQVAEGWRAGVFWRYRFDTVLGGAN